MRTFFVFMAIMCTVLVLSSVSNFDDPVLLKSAVADINTRAFTFFDFNGDNMQDIITFQDGVFYSLENQNGLFRNKTQIYDPGLSDIAADDYFQFWIEDLNSDGIPELIFRDFTDIVVVRSSNTGYSVETIDVGYDSVYKIAAGDMNNNGEKEIFLYGNDFKLAVRDNSNNTYSITSITTDVPIIFTDYFCSFSLKDINNDGCLDLFTGNSVQNKVGWYEFDTATLSVIQFHDVYDANGFVSFKHEDFNSDGLWDVAYYDGNSNEVKIALNDNNQSFSSQQTVYAANEFIHQIVISDMNDDGNYDFLMQCNDGFDVLIYSNGVYQLQQDRLKMWASHFVDVDGDGCLDLVSDGIAYCRNGEYTAGNYSNFSFAGNMRSEVLDVQGDGFNDLILADRGNISIINNSDTGLDDFSSAFLGWDLIIDWDAADLDNNGQMDYIVSHSITLPWSANNCRLSIYMNNDNNAVNSHIFTGNVWLHTDFADLDNDNDLDIIIKNRETERLSVFENTNNSFDLTAPVEIPFDVADYEFGDMNFDGLVDIVSYNNLSYADEYETKVIVNSGNLSFSEIFTIISESSKIDHIELEDFNSDEVTDLMYGTYTNNYGVQETLIYGDGSLDRLSNGPRETLFERDRQWRTEPLSPNYYITDVDGDRDLDCVIGVVDQERWVYYVTIAINEGYAKWTTYNIDSLGFELSNFFVGDIDNDGLDDIVFENDGDGSLMVMYNNNTLIPNSDTDIPEYTTRLLGNYPNPFNPETKITYSLANAGNAELSIYNIKGQRIKTLVNDHVEAGEHSIIWNGKDNNNSDVSSGVYFYRLKTADGVQNRKMLLLK